ncbi:Bleomycin resistance protein [Beijerinckiaceae bacterium RH AL1]|nr:VOC family protein [Beijerinckiaceae bacterium]VVB49691.1 Bleomycin resistance protein [Beijerinckiaceae bacterium RH CH11]VVB49768.1 Bleomycin resistance protein [Beijerinckiaceae bacterium RH AL8]VVC57029.1 Bleomycin resistance protein [Beijerinckiaceae bacterium RH AL1]
MKLDHLAVWTRDIDRLAAFWQETFGAEVGAVYESRNQVGFRSRFVTLPGGLRLELMSSPLHAAPEPPDRTGLAHMALSLGGEAAVDAAAARLAAHLVAKPRRTGDGYYEAIIRDPDGNLVELVA